MVPLSWGVQRLVAHIGFLCRFLARALHLYSLWLPIPLPFGLAAKYRHNNFILFMLSTHRLTPLNLPYPNSRKASSILSPSLSIVTALGFLGFFIANANGQHRRDVPRNGSLTVGVLVTPLVHALPPDYSPRFVLVDADVCGSFLRATVFIEEELGQKKEHINNHREIPRVAGGGSHRADFYCPSNHLRFKNTDFPGNGHPK